MEYKLEKHNKNATKASEIGDGNIHILSRRSPYIGTNIQRFPVFDNNTSWTDSYYNYDPVFLNKPVVEFPIELQHFVDYDNFFNPLEENEDSSESDSKIDEELSSPKEITSRSRSSSDSPMTNTAQDNPLSPGAYSYASVNIEAKSRDVLSVKSFVRDRQAFIQEFNNKTLKQTDTGESYILDRTTWCIQNSEPIGIYDIDVRGLPRNPFGRTGVYGRGDLWRWGPNHTIYAIITRFSENRSLGFNRGSLTKDGKPIIEVCVVPMPMYRENFLPGGFIAAYGTEYSTLVNAFQRYLQGEGKAEEGTNTLDKEDMVQFFRQYTSTNLNTILGSTQQYFEAREIYKGYIDDMRNTDNAWIEAIIWNFHYPKRNTFDTKIKSKEKFWQQVSPSMNLYSAVLPHVLKVQQIIEKKAFL